MAWRIGAQVIRGQIDNREKDKVTGEIWLHGWAEPIRLDLHGNPRPDLAGRLITFQNPHPEYVQPDQLFRFVPSQQGISGDMTRQRAGRALGVPVDKVREDGGIYLEWFSHENGRVVMEGAGFRAELSEATWQPTAADVAEQEERCDAAWQQFLDELCLTLSQQNGKRLDQSVAAPLAAGPSERPGAESAEEKRADLMLRITELKHELEQLNGGPVVHAPSGHLTLAQEEAFLRRVRDFEVAPVATGWELLRRDGFTPRPSGAVSENEIHGELWKVIRGLQRQRIYLGCTDHLSDRKLYELLLEQILPEETQVITPGADWNCFIDVSDYPVEGLEPIQVFLRYYADESTRQEWAEEFPDLPVPPRREPPYDRDERLPQVPPGHVVLRNEPVKP